MRRPDALPAEWLQRIWSTMRAHYGASFDRQWAAPPGVELDDHVRDLLRVWGRELAVFEAYPPAIHYALDNLPPHPQTLGEFKALCRRRPDPPQAKQLPEPKADPRRVRQALDLIGGAMNPGRASTAPLAWAWDLRTAELHAGGRLRRGGDITRAQRAAWRTALARSLGDRLEDKAIRHPQHLSKEPDHDDPDLAT